MKKKTAVMLSMLALFTILVLWIVNLIGLFIPIAMFGFTTAPPNASAMDALFVVLFVYFIFAVIASILPAATLILGFFGVQLPIMAGKKNKTVFVLMIITGALALVATMNIVGAIPLVIYLLIYFTWKPEEEMDLSDASLQNPARPYYAPMPGPYPPPPPPGTFIPVKRKVAV